jgi:hypothetical protein
MFPLLINKGVTQFVEMFDDAVHSTAESAFKPHALFNQRCDRLLDVLASADIVQCVVFVNSGPT